MSACAHYPIVQVLTSMMAEAGLSREEFVASIGYRRGDRGLRRLNLWLDTGDGFPLIITQIKRGYPEWAAELDSAILATQEIRWAERKARWIESLKAEAATFRPYIHVQGETRVPNFICGFAMTGGKWNLIEIPDDVRTLEVPEQLEMLPVLMLEYLDRYRGQCPFFGKVTGFRYVRLLDYYQFDEEGQFVQYVNEPFRRGTCAVSL
jgi:hypothetical protein